MSTLPTEPESRSNGRVMLLVSAAAVLIAIVAVVAYLVVGRTPARQLVSHTGPSQAIRVTSDSGKVAADYYPVAVLDSPAHQDYSPRAGAAAHCVADDSLGAFGRFHAALFNIGTQPSETGSTFPDNAAFTQLARRAGAAGGIAAGITSGKYLSIVKNAATAGQVSATPTVRINGEDYDPSTPDALEAKIQALLGTSNL